jgi:hypothetical protein
MAGIDLQLNPGDRVGAGIRITPGARGKPGVRVGQPSEQEFQSLATNVNARLPKPPKEETPEPEAPKAPKEKTNAEKTNEEIAALAEEHGGERHREEAPGRIKIWFNDGSTATYGNNWVDDSGVVTGGLDWSELPTYEGVHVNTPEESAYQNRPWVDPGDYRQINMTARDIALPAKGAAGTYAGDLAAAEASGVQYVSDNEGKTYYKNGFVHNNRELPNRTTTSDSRLKNLIKVIHRKF